MSDPDLVVVGAGAAGLAAAMRARELGLTAVVLEAAGRRGGRAHTDHGFGFPVDFGCHWLHSASVNPWRAEADRLGYAYHRRFSRRDRTTIRDGAVVPKRGQDRLWTGVDAAFAAIRAAGEAGRDVAADAVIAEAVAATSPDAAATAEGLAYAEHWIGLFTSAATADLSTADLAAYTDTHEDWPVENGYGALILEATAAVAVELATPVTAIDWSGAGVAVTTPRGTIRARAAVVTVSTAVLAGGAIRFTPVLPVGLREAVEACPLGRAEKLMYRLDRPLERFGPTAYGDLVDGSGGRPPLTFQINGYGRPFLVAMVAGAAAERLNGASGADLLALGREALAAAFGTDFPARITAEAVTGWRADPLVGGAYSYARPGRAALRARLAEPVGGRVFLAGEAVSTTAFSTAHGARATGIDAVERAAAALGRG